MKKQSVRAAVIAIVILLACWGVFWLWSTSTETVEAVVNNYNINLPPITYAKVTITGIGEDETFISNSTGEAGPFHLRASYLYTIFVEWQGIRYSNSSTLPEGDRVDLLIVIDTVSMTVKVCEFLVISQVIIIQQ